MRRVWKFGPLEIDTLAQITAPAGARVVAFSAQGGQHLYLWAEVDEDAPLRPLRYVVVGTGRPVPTVRGSSAHAGTWVSDEYVWHLYVALDQ